MVRSFASDQYFACFGPWGIVYSAAIVAEEMRPVSKKQSLSPAEVRQTLGLSTKALRLYEQLKLIAPHKSANGWRVYGPEDVSRLYQIKVLRNFGLTLVQIAELLRSGGDGTANLASVLALHTDVLKEDQQRIAAALQRVVGARQLLEGGNKVTFEDLVKLGEQANFETDESISSKLKPYLSRYFTQDDYRAFNAVADNNWKQLLQEALALYERNPDPASAAAAALLDKWQALARVYSGGNEVLEQKSAAMFEEAMRHPDAQRHPIPLHIWTFLKAIKAHVVTNQTENKT